ncbi:winged helix-turn-helix transcriptional regulator [Lactococcus termiticola]|uniref:MarR family transcriptional regulator n=1 Tax=Lactococcus termiticola TaxID=2169526 RepID=A0A2R5HJR0_9LACT|nr:helix-turn-helix domain-containing protein [Lactococcus termiticola]GBG96571.1 MarR family transcriptional regulator [Lactococcus termiticola]
MSEEHCLASEAISMIKGRYSIEILTAIYRGNQHYNSLLREIPGINSRILALRLREFEDKGLLTRTVLRATAPYSIRYELREKALALVPIIQALSDYAKKA